MKSLKNLNKKLFKFSLLLLFLSMYAVECVAQTEVNYSYDAAGNRIKRKVGTFLQKTEHTDKDSIIAMEHGISIYPNPANDKINVSVTSATENKKAVATLLDNAGRILFSQEVNSSNPLSFDINKYQPGIYFMKIAIGKEQLSYQVVKTY